jgi:hypothetical protein
LDCGVGVVVVTEGCVTPPAPHPDAAPVKAPLRIAGLFYLLDRLSFAAAPNLLLRNKEIERRFPQGGKLGQNNADDADEHRCCNRVGCNPTRIALMTAKHVRMLRDELAKLPGAARNRLKALKALFAWAVDQGLATHDPTFGVKSIPYVTKSHHTWTLEEVEQYERRHPIGTKARLGLALLLYTSWRRGDAPRIRPQHIYEEKQPDGTTKKRVKYRYGAETLAPKYRAEAKVRAEQLAPLIREMQKRGYSMRGFANGAVAFSFLRTLWDQYGRCGTLKLGQSSLSHKPNAPEAVGGFDAARLVMITSCRDLQQRMPPRPQE